MDEQNYKDLVEAIAQAAWESREHLRKHLRREEDDEIQKELEDKEVKNADHYFIEEFQKSVVDLLKNNTNITGYTWIKEDRKSDAVVKDSIDIIGKMKGRNCIIEIDATRHDQIAPKFVSRLALWGLEEPIDYIILLYDSTLKSGKHSAEKFVRYTHAILKATNNDSSLICIYVHTPKTPNNLDKDYLEYWDCDKQAFTINVKEYKGKFMTMNECAREAINFYIKKHKKITYKELQNRFNKGITFISDNEGKSRANLIEEKVEDRKEIYVYSQFRYNGRQHNWNRFVEVCKGTKDMKQKDKITIIEIFKPDAHHTPSN